MFGLSRFSVKFTVLSTRLSVSSSCCLHTVSRTPPKLPHLQPRLSPTLSMQQRLLSTKMSNPTAPEDPIVKALQEFTTCDVSDALIKLKYRNGGFLSGLTMWSPQRQDGDTKIVGPAYTVEYVPLDDPRPKHQGHYIDSVPAGAVIFVSCPPKIPNAVYGGLMSTRAKASGAVGSVIDGRFRDLQEQRGLVFPIFARDVGTAPPAELLKVAAVNVPVKLQTDEQDMTVRPGDYLIGDVNGVVVLPKELAEQVIPLMKKQVEADEKMAVEIAKGMTFVEASRKFRL
ncbi:ribonuclease E inhibitor RraA/Dimethylmenaquinone methyltransferase [Triangularia verruculosa]|uniref:Ribonuclease E inhibitor RraA/Dimethylmenaquinone methyltransferase n=1 Tax=Triangularia verruculosa TaxID=2587418 RepID=A0AAN6XBD9_9PEZI|nr:ribonuclease E inhibitor RraA/Dimethylmenaquinone methyltransferase [Triangularia verruculosa]